MDRMTQAYRILHPLNIRIDDAERLTEIRDIILDMQISSDELEPYFTKIAVFNSYLDFHTNEEKWKIYYINGFWSTKVIDEIKKIDGVMADYVRVGKPPMTLEQALAEVDAAVMSAQLEHEREAAIIEQYSKVRSHSFTLFDYGYKNTYKLMNTQASFDRNSVLGEIADTLADVSSYMESIANSLTEINSKM